MNKDYKINFMTEKNSPFEGGNKLTSIKLYGWYNQYVDLN